MIIPKEQTWRGWLIVGVGLTIFGVLSYLSGNDIIVSFLWGFLFLCIAYSSYNFSKKKVVHIGKNLTILFLVLFVILLFFGYAVLSGEILLVGFIFLIYWYFENKEILKII